MTVHQGIVEEAGGLPLGQFTTITGDCFRYNTCVYILHMMCEATILVILCMGLPITTTIASE